MRRMTTEIELKFRIPPDRLAAVRRAVATASARAERFAAVYVDTPGDALAHAGVALRLRREGPVWAQTLKAEGSSAMQRLEHNVALGEAPSPPALDLRRHDGTEAGAALRRVLAQAGEDALTERYATEITRTWRVLRHGGARIEVALDEGHIRAGQRSLPVCEIEFELLQGPPQALLDLAARWVDRFGLVLDVRSKSERGHLLAADRLASPPAQVGALRLSPQASPAQALAAMLANTLRPVLANASVLADDTMAAAVAAEPEYLHQLRVGLRRLRSVMRVFGAMASPSGDARAAGRLVDGVPVDGGPASALAALFDQLGVARDQDVMAEWLWPALRAAGAPAFAEVVDPRAPAPVDVAALLRARATQRLWLAALAAGLAPAEPPAGLPARRPPLTPALARPLQRLLRQVQRDAGRFAELNDAGRHRLRRRVKRLRYCAEAIAALWPARAAAATLKRLQQAQALLGVYNDTVVALAHCQSLAVDEPRAWFAVGWLSARREALASHCGRHLPRRLPSHGFWAKHRRRPKD